MYNFFKYLMRILFLFVFRIQIHHKERIPKEGGLIVVANHKSNFDPIIVSFITRRPIHFMAKSELHNTKFKRWLFEGVKTIRVDRSKNDITAIKRALKVLKAGDILGVFPEGTRVRDEDEKNSAKAGAVLLAEKSSVPILPVRIDASYRLFSKVDVYILPIFELPRESESQKDHEEIAQMLMEKIYEHKE